MQHPEFLLKNMPRGEMLRAAARACPWGDMRALEAFGALLETSAEVLSAVNAGLGSSGVSQARFRLLLMLLRGGKTGGMHPMELADALGVERATITGLVDSAEKDGLVRRTPCPEDRRSVTVSLTPKGRALTSRLAPQRLKKVAELMGGLSAAEKSQLVKLLDKIMSRVPAFRKI